ncbi:hypothetical protein G7Y79_00017g042900 [Physcia stellaris]|nr:hypothetical protein G7Y79_00017g042900 [Physcia stellaris]
MASRPCEIPHNKPPMIEKQLQSVVIRNTTDNEEASELPPIPFLTLPYDIRLQIYRWAVGNRMIHIVAKNATCPLHPHYCTSRVSEAQKYEYYSKPVVFKNRIDFWMRPRDAPLYDLHRFCGYPTDGATPEDAVRRKLDLGLLRVSQEAYREAGKCFWMSNRWSFASTTALRRFLVEVPPQMISLIRHLHLTMHVDGDLEHPKEDDSIYDSPGTIFNITAWKKILDDIMPVRFKEVQTLNLSIYLQGHPGCYRRSQGPEFSAMFQSLRRLRLKEFTVVMNQNTLADCHQRLHIHNHNNDTHGLSVNTSLSRTFFERKELMRVWAEEIREVVLGKE